MPMISRSRLIRSAGSFHREDRAQISVLAIAGFICFVGLLAMVINTNDTVTRRVHMQDVADVTALSAASWTARGMNLTAFVNVLNSKLITTAVLLNAVKDSLPVIIAVGQLQQKIFTACSPNPWTAWFCVPMNVVVGIQLGALNYLKSAIEPMARNLSKCPNGALWKMMRGLETGIAGVKTTFVGIGFAEAMAIATANGATQGFAVNGKLVSGTDGIFLPIDRDKSKFNQFCPFMANGGPGYEMQDYACSTGPLPLGKERIKKTLLAPFVNLLSWPIFNGMVVSHVSQIGCQSVAGTNAGVKVMLQDLNECKKYSAKATWGHVFSYTEEMDDNSLRLEDFVPWMPQKKYKGSKGADDVTDPSKGLGNINLPDDIPTDVDTSGTPDVQWGKGLQYIPKANEFAGQPATIKRKCGSKPLPYYGHFIGDWDTLVAGRISPIDHPLICGADCKRIDKHTSHFKAYDHTHKAVTNISRMGGYYIRVTPVEIEQDDDKPSKWRYIVETVSLISAGETTMSPKDHEKYLKDQIDKDINTEGTQDSASCSEDNKPKPWMLDKGTTKQSQEDYEDRLRFFSVVIKKTSENPPFWSTFFSNPPNRTVAYSQAQVYNYLSEDTFTQDWRVRLEQATLLEEYLNKVGIPGMPPANGSLGAVNNH